MQLSNISSKIFEIIWFQDLKSLKIFSRDLYHMPSEIFINHLDKIFWLGVGGAGFSFWVIRMNYSHLTIRRVPCTDCTACQRCTDQNGLVRFSGPGPKNRRLGPDQNRKNLRYLQPTWNLKSRTGPAKNITFGPDRTKQNFKISDRTRTNKIWPIWTGQNLFRTSHSAKVFIFWFKITHWER